MGTQLNLSSAYHPKTNGQNERENQVIEDMLRSYCGQQPCQWLKFLPLVEFAYNSLFHRRLQMSPFKALYRQECLTPLRLLANPNLFVPTAKKTLEEMNHQLQVIRENLKKSNDQQKSYANLKLSVREFKAGDQMFIPVKPKKSSLRLGKCKKLAYRYCGPFKVTKRIGEQAYELDSPSHLHVHDIFHVSLLKQYIADSSHVLNHDNTILVTQ